MIKNQLSELSSRLDNLELSLKKDIHSILDLLHQQQQIQLQQHTHHQSQPQLREHLQHPQTGKQNVMTASYQPSESDFSFDNLSTTTDNNSKQPHSLPPGGAVGIRDQQPTQQRNVQRSVSQPECASDKSLFR